MKNPRSIPIRCPRGRVAGLLLLGLLTSFAGVGKSPSLSRAESPGPLDTVAPPAFWEVDPYDGGLVAVDGGSAIMDPEGIEELLERHDDGDTETFDMEFVTVLEGGSVEVGDNHIEVPPFALSQDTWMALYVPLSGSIEYWAYPPDIQFNLPVEIRFSYKHADSTGVNEQSITIDQWLPQFQLWDIVGGIVDTQKKRVTADVMQFPPGVVDSVAEHSRFALADHN